MKNSNNNQCGKKGETIDLQPPQNSPYKRKNSDYNQQR